MVMPCYQEGKSLEIVREYSEDPLDKIWLHQVEATTMFAVGHCRTCH